MSVADHKKICKLCNLPFEAPHRKQICDKCVSMECKKCKTVYTVRPYQLLLSRYCSKRCAFDDRNGKVELTCKLCKKKYRNYISQVKLRGSSFCSMKCRLNFTKTKFYQTKTKKDSTQKLKKQLWSVFSRYIRQRDDGICFTCGQKNNWRNTDAGHFIPKTSGLELYFDEINVNCQCRECNRTKGGNVQMYEYNLRQKYGDKMIDMLIKRKEKITKISLSEYKKLIQFFKNKELQLKKFEIRQF
jgi:hypothetical protein